VGCAAGELRKTCISESFPAALAVRPRRAVHRGACLAYPNGLSGSLAGLCAARASNRLLAIAQTETQERLERTIPVATARRRSEEIIMLIGQQPKEFLLAVEALTVSFDGFKAVNDLSFYVEENEIRVIIGPNGAGKTTVLDLICGKTKGDLRLDPVSRQGAHPVEGRTRSCRTGVGRKFQTPSVFVDLTVFENLEISYPRGRTVFGSAGPFQRDAAGEEACREKVAEMIFLKDRLDTYADELSHGKKQWLEIGMLLIQDPDLLMLDEPGRRHERERARPRPPELLNRIIKDRSVLVIEHDMKFVEDIAHKVTCCTRARSCPRARWRR
jgi:urea transport system ATP-binding protein